MYKSPLAKTTNILLFVILITSALYFAKPFLVPLTFAAILAMLFVPLSKKMEEKGVHKAISAIICILLLLFIFFGIGSLLAWQISDMSKDMTNIQPKLKEFLSNIETYIANTFGIDAQRQEQIMKEQSKSGGSSVGALTKITGSIMSVFVNAILVLVYMFLFMYFRGHLKKFLLKVAPEDQKQNIGQLTHEAPKVSQQYILGLGMMIGTLWILYGIGFTIVGVKNALFFAILCGILEIVPFIGNITGTALTVLMALVTGGGSNLVIGILITYGLVQFIQTYILEPLVVGDEVNINPLITIAGIVAGESIWGIPGMILAIPLLGILKIVCDHFEPLKPYGFLLGQEKTKKTSSVATKIKNWKKKFANPTSS